MIKLLTSFECTVGEKTGRFICEHDTSTEAAKIMIFEFSKMIDQIEEVAKAKLEEEKKKQEEEQKNNSEQEQV